MVTPFSRMFELCFLQWKEGRVCMYVNGMTTEQFYQRLHKLFLLQGHTEHIASVMIAYNICPPPPLLTIKQIYHFSLKSF